MLRRAVDVHLMACSFIMPTTGLSASAPAWLDCGQFAVLGIWRSNRHMRQCNTVRTQSSSFNLQQFIHPALHPRGI